MLKASPTNFEKENVSPKIWVEWRFILEISTDSFGGGRDFIIQEKSQCLLKSFLVYEAFCSKIKIIKNKFNLKCCDCYIDEQQYLALGCVRSLFSRKLSGLKNEGASFDLYDHSSFTRVRSWWRNFPAYLVRNASLPPVIVSVTRKGDHKLSKIIYKTSTDGFSRSFQLIRSLPSVYQWKSHQEYLMDSMTGYPTTGNRGSDWIKTVTLSCFLVKRFPKLSSWSKQFNATKQRFDCTASAVSFSCFIARFHTAYFSKAHIKRINVCVSTNVW